MAWIRLIAVCAVCAVLAGVVQAAPKASMTACTDDRDHPPFTLLAGEGTAQKLLREVANKRGLHWRVVFEPRARCLSSVASGTYDAYLLASDAAAESGQFAFPMRNGRPDAQRSLGVATIVLLHRKGSTVAWDGEVLRGSGRPVVYPAGYMGTRAALARLGIAGEASARSARQAMAMLQFGRTDVIALRDAEWEDAVDPSASGIERLYPPLVQVGVYIAFNRRFAEQHTDWIEAVWDAAAQARETLTAGKRKH